MKGDFTRNTFDPTRHFSRVLMQQGRVQLDADWNEQAAIVLHYLRALAADLIGPHGGPEDGFRIGPAFDASGNRINNDFVIHSGHYYVEGILCENDPMLDDQGKPVAVTYFTQPDYALDKTQDPLPNPPFLVYLDVWERHLTYLEADDPLDGNSIREVALGGPDTATRARIVWQAKVLQPTEGTPALTCTNADEFLKSRLTAAHRGSLRARAKQDQPPTDPCVIVPDARYRGPENLLYRVEIHTGSRAPDGTATQPTFKWSRENGAVIFPIVSGPSFDATTSTTTVGLAHLGRDAKLGLAKDDWVEMVDDDYTLHNRAQALLKVIAVDRAEMTVTLKGATPISGEQDKHPFLRRWDQQPTDPKQGGVELVVEGTGEDDSDWIALEDGVQIQFPAPAAGQPAHEYRTGDYWLIPARTATGDVDWPKFKATDLGTGQTVLKARAMLPNGILHHYAPLAIISPGTPGAVGWAIQNCQCSIRAICYGYGYGMGDTGIGGDLIGPE